LGFLKPLKGLGELFGGFKERRFLNLIFKEGICDLEGNGKRGFKER